MAHQRPPADPRDVLTRSAPPPDFTVAYGDAPEQIADVRLPPPDAGPHPLVIVIHGGFWMAEYDRAHVGPLAADLAARGYPVATLEYRRIGDDGGGWPGTFDDVAAGVAALPSLVSDALNHRRLTPLAESGTVVIGHSAGGMLALWVGRRIPGIRAIVALAPVADMRRGFVLGLGDGAVAAVLGGSPDEVPDRYAAVDPAMNLPIGAPTVVVHGHLDKQVPYPVGRDWALASAVAGDPTVLIDLADIEHYAIIDPLSSAWSSVLVGLATVCNVGRG
jgi:acetyl esterase/lipase